MKFNDFFINENISSRSYKKIPENSLFFDIETTGLSAVRSSIYLIGCAWLTTDRGEKKWTVHQFFLDHPARERDLLKLFAECLKKHAGTIIHYNGSSFDIPYLSKKYQYYGMRDPFADLRGGRTIDLYRTLRPFRHLLGMTSMKQKNTEELLGIRRKDRFSGKELIDVYENYLSTGDKKLLDALFLHNAEDVANMLPIYPLTCLASFFGGNFATGTIDRSSQNGDITVTLIPEDVTPVPVRAENELCSLVWTGQDAKLTIRPFCGTLKRFFPDYKNYYFLPAEDQAIHKSVGAFVDPAYREPAKAQNCYQKRTGVFLPQPRERITPVFKDDYRSKRYFFLYDPAKIPAGSVSGNVTDTAYFVDLLETLLDIR